MNNIIPIIKDYLELKNTNYALLINGVWGAGKTYFLKNELFNEIHKIKSIAKDEDQKEIMYKTIYVSLYGLNNSSEINKEVMRNFLPLFTDDNTNKKGAVFNAIKGTLTGLSKNFLGLDIEKIISLDDLISFIPLENYVLCFDDIERVSSKFEITDVLGTINKFVEQYMVKTIILGNEEKLNVNDNEVLDKRKQDWLKYKEKMIGITIEFKNTIENILSIITNDFIGDKGFANFLQRHQSTLILIVKGAEIENLRILKFAVINMYQIYKIIEDLKLTDLNEKHLIMEVFSVTIEYKLGKLNSEYETLLLSFDPFVYSMLNEDSKEDNFLNNYYKKYFRNSEDTIGYIFLNTIFNYIISGVKNNIEIQEEILQKYTKSKTEPQIHLTNIQNYMNLSDEDFNKSIKYIFHNIRLYNIIECLKIYLYLIQFNKQKLIAANEIDIYGIIKKAIENNKEIKFNTFESDIRSFYGSDLKDLIEIANKRKLFLEEEQLKKSFASIVNSSDLVELLRSANEIYYNKPILKFVNLEDFKRTLTQMTNHYLNSIRQLILSRYYSPYVSLLSDEKKFLEFLSKAFLFDRKNLTVGELIKQKISIECQIILRDNKFNKE